MKHHVHFTTNEELTTLLKRIGKKLSDIRHAGDEKMETTALAIGKHHSVVSQVENGIYKCLSFELLSKFALHYKLSIDEILAP